MPGGGVAYVRCLSALENIKAESDKMIGVNIVKNAMMDPIKQIINNAGLDGSVIANEVRSNSSINYGFDAQNEEYCDMLERGVIDPTKVTRTALQNAASVASLLLTTSVMVTDLPEKEEKMPGMPGGPPGMGDMY